MAEEMALPEGQWAPAFPGQRPPFKPGNDAGVRFRPGNTAGVHHGAYATVQLGPRVAELADEIRDLIPGYSPADEVALRVLCLALARLEQSSAAIDDDTPAADLARLRQDERGWANTIRRYLADLGLTPVARSGLGLNVARARGEVLRAHLAENYGGEEADRDA